MVTLVQHHPVVLRGAEAHHASGGPLLLERTDEDFLAAVLAELRGAPGLPTTGDARLAQTFDRDHVLKLQQPVHRTFYVALFDVACDVYGQPRLDPQRIDSAGLVVRRRRVADDGTPLPISPAGTEGWRQGGTVLKGWLSLDNPRVEDLDPDPIHRPPALTAGHPEIDRQLALHLSVGALSETFSPLFTAPPEVCEATGRTILYGLVPLASAEQSTAPAQLPPFDAAARQEIRDNLPRLFRQNDTRYIPCKGQTLSADGATQPGMDEFVTMLRQIAIEFDAFGTATAAAQALLWELNTLMIDFPGDKQRPAGDFLHDASRAFVERDPTVTVQMPAHDWPTIDADREKRILGRVVECLRAQLNVVTPHEGRFDDLTRQYVARGFVRVKHEDGCPPETVWSEYSPPFRIAAWYESGNAPPVKIILPDASDKAFLKTIKPNVSFVVPPGLFKKLQSPPESWLKGEVKGDASSLGLNWICSFSIPIITLCAFIVLSIFLGLFNLIFQWMLWVKICIPFPVRNPRPQS